VSQSGAACTRLGRFDTVLFASAIEREQLLPANVPIELLEHVKLVGGILGDEHGTECEAIVGMMQEVVWLSGNACVLHNGLPRSAGLVK